MMTLVTALKTNSMLPVSVAHVAWQYTVFRSGFLFNWTNMSRMKLMLAWYVLGPVRVGGGRGRRVVRGGGGEGGRDLMTWIQHTLQYSRGGNGVTTPTPSCTSRGPKVWFTADLPSIYL